MANETRGHDEGGGGSGGNGDGVVGSGGGVGGKDCWFEAIHSHFDVDAQHSLVHGQFSHPTNFRRTPYTHVLAVVYNLHSFGTQFSNLP